MTETKFIFLEDSWARCEELIYSIGMKNIDETKKKFRKDKWERLYLFLKDIGFVDDRNFSQLGEEYYKSRYIQNDDEIAKKILFNAVVNFQPTQAICQILWGRPNITRKSVYRLLVLKEFINPKNFKEDSLGGFLMLLNSTGIINFNKKTNGVRIQFNPSNVEISNFNTVFLSPETPYSNVKKLREIIRASSNYVYWVDKHFSGKGLDSLIDEVDGNNVNKIKILASTASNSINIKFRSEFERFRSEMKTREVNAELRVICDKELSNLIHDRWLISEKMIYNIPPVNVIYQGQYSEFKKTENEPPFEEWWLRGLDIINQWEDISKNINNIQS